MICLVASVVFLACARSLADTNPRPDLRANNDDRRAAEFNHLLDSQIPVALAEARQNRGEETARRDATSAGREVREKLAEERLLKIDGQKADEFLRSINELVRQDLSAVEKMDGRSVTAVAKVREAMHDFVTIVRYMKDHEMARMEAEGARLRQTERDLRHILKNMQKIKIRIPTDAGIQVEVIPDPNLNSIRFSGLLEMPPQSMEDTGTEATRENQGGEANTEVGAA